MYTFCMSGAGLGVDRNGAGLGGARPENRQASSGQSSLLAGCWLIHITRCCLAWSPYKMLKNWMAVANRPPAQHSNSQYDEDGNLFVFACSCINKYQKPKLLRS